MRPRRFARRSGTAVFLALLIGLLGSGTPTALAATRPLPSCSYQDRLTRYRLYSHWPKTLLDTIRMVPSTYAPRDLMSTTAAGLNGRYVRDHVIPQLRRMTAAARAARAAFAVQSGYRSYATQKRVFEAEVKRYGYRRAIKQSARPGHSEHQLGTTIDFRSADSTKVPWEYTDWGTTRAGRWLAANAHRYGFVMSYPKGKTHLTCYIYEPWHYRYVGAYLAARIKASGLTLREYLWRHYETLP